MSVGATGASSGESPSARRTSPAVLIAAWVLVGCSAGAVWSVSRPALYRAACVLQYERESPGSPRDPVDSYLTAQEWLNTQDYVLTSSAVAERVVQKLQLQRDRGSLGARSRAQTARSSADTAASQLRDRTTIRRVRDTRLVRVEYEDADAKRAANIANAIAAAYLEKVIEDRITSQQRSLQWLANEIEATTQRMQSADSELRSTLELPNAPPMPVAQRQEMLTTELKQLNQLLTAARVRRIELAARLTKLKAAQRDDPFTTHTIEIDEHPQARALQAEQLKATLRQAELSTRGAADLAVAMEQARLTTLREQLRVVIAGIVQSAQAELAEAQGIEAQLQTQLDSTASAARELQTQQLVLGRLERERSDTAELLKTLRDRSMALGVASAAGAADARVVEPAVPPTATTGQPLPVNAGIGALCGLALAIAWRKLVARRSRPHRRRAPLGAPNTHAPHGDF